MSFSNQALVESLLSTLEEKKATFSIAESCTCGLLSAAFAYRSGVSKYFLGGVVSYANSAKEALIDVAPTTLQSFGAVSKEVAREMAVGVRNKLVSDWSLSVTGIAGPTGGSSDKPVGTICFAVVGPNFEEVRREHFSGDRERVQAATVDYGLRFLTNSILKK